MATGEQGTSTAGRRWSKKLLTVIAVVLVLIVVGGTAAYVVISTPPPTKVLVVGTTDDEITFDTADSYDYFSINIIQNTMAMLLTYAPGTTNLEPDILSEVPTRANGGISVDELTYTLRIRPNVRFDDAERTPINASVVKYSIDRAVKLNGIPGFLLESIKGANEYWAIPGDAANATRKASALANYTAQGVVVVDNLTVRVNLYRKWAPFVTLLAFSITAPVRPQSFTDDRFYPNVIVSSGPYRLAKYIPHQRYELEANPNYYGDAPKVSKVVVVQYSTAVDLKLAIETGEIDVAYRSLLPQDFNELAADPSLRTLEGDSPVIRYLVFNTCDAAGVGTLWCPRASPFSDPRLRQALGYATNRTDIATAAYAGSVDPLYSLVPNGMPFHTDAFLTRYGAAPNIAAAQALLVDAGFSATSKMPITLWYTPTHYGDPEIFVAQALKRAWEATTMITVTIDQREWTDYRTAYRSGQFDVFLLGWFPDYFDSDNYVFPFLHSASGGTKSFGNFYRNSTMDTAIEAQAATTDPAQRAPLFAEIQAGLAWDAPYLPLFQSKQQVVFRPNVSGITLDPIQFFRYFEIGLA